MNIFVSYSRKDKSIIVDKIRQVIRRNGFTPLIAEDDLSLSETITEKVERLINSSELAVVVLTKNGQSTAFVQQEIGYLQKSKKPMLILVEKGIEEEVSGFLYGRDYLTIDPEDLETALTKTEERILSFNLLWKRGKFIAVAVLTVFVLFLIWGFSRGSQ